MMRIPPYWAKSRCTGKDRKGREQEFWAWGWSFQSLAEATRDAAARAGRILDCFSRGTTPDSYDYLEHPLREEIVESISQDGEAAVVITRNRYGALVLNSSSVCFVDVDFPEVKSRGFLDALLLAFSARRRRERRDTARETTLEAVRQWAQQNAQHSFRMYRTAAGLRLLFTDRLYDPTSREVDLLLEELGSDRLYRKLTLKQECFRARLTPKPWRCGCKRPPNRYPWDEEDEERIYRRWQENYENRAKAYGICRLVETFGAPSPDDWITTVITLHDQYACRESEADLA